MSRGKLEAPPTSIPEGVVSEKPSSSVSPNSSLLSELAKSTDRMMLWLDKYYLVSDRYGKLTKIDAVTGEAESVEVESSLGYLDKEYDIDKFYSFRDEEGRTVLVPKNIRFSDKFLARFSRRMDYNPVVGQEIIDLIMEGKSINTITKRRDMPSVGLLYRWRKEVPSFGLKVKEALAYRRENFNEILQKDIEEMDKEPERFLNDKMLNVLKTKHQSMLKMLSQKDDTKEKGNFKQVVNVQINTGFDTDKQLGGEVIDVSKVSDDEFR